MARVKRGAITARKAATNAGQKARLHAARARTGSLIDIWMARLPVSEETLHRIFVILILGGALALGLVVASFAGVPAMANAEAAKLSRAMGFAVRRVEVHGTRHLDELSVYTLALGQRNRAMPFVDVRGLRGALLELAWVKDARVSRRLPDTLVIDIIERTPRAAMRVASDDAADNTNAPLVLIDGEGHALEPVARAHGRLIVSGEGVAGEMGPLARLLDAAPALKPAIAEARWIGNRRWNLIFTTGQILELPEGEVTAANALVAFARLDGTNRLLGGRAVAFDMRAPDRIYLRIPGRADAEATATLATGGGGAAAGPHPAGDALASKDTR